MSIRTLILSLMMSVFIVGSYQTVVAAEYAKETASSSSDTGERADNGKDEFPFWCQIAGTGEDGYLEILIMSQDLDAKELVNKKEFVDKYGRTAFMWAARHGKICNLKYLRGVDKSSLYIRDNKGRTPMFFAAQSGHVSVMEYFYNLAIEDGYDPREIINAQDINGRPVLYYSFYFEGETSEAMSWLLEKGAKYGNVDIYRYADIYGCSILIYLATLGKTERIRALLDIIPDHIINSYINHSDVNGRTALSYAAEEGAVEIVRLLVLHGARVDEQDNVGRTPLMYATITVQRDAVSYLLEVGADYHSLRDDYGRTAFLYDTDNLLVTPFFQNDIRLAEEEVSTSLEVTTGSSGYSDTCECSSSNTGGQL